MKTYIIAATLAAALFSCDSKEKEHLQLKVDSLNYVLAESQKAEKTMNEVGALLDSIDNSQHVLHVRMAEGTTYADYLSRLNQINTHIKESQEKIAVLETKLKTSKAGSSSAINRLKTDLEMRSKEIVSLQLEVITLRDKNGNLNASLSQKDSTISSQSEVIKLKTDNVSALEGLVKDIDVQNRMKVASLYLAQGQALETAADRTKFAWRKKKATRLEALELYKLSYSLGNAEAQVKMQELEKKLS